jgi:ABC-2 type transport system ATP-binding protein
VEGAATERVGDLAHEHGLVLHGLAEVSGSLEQAYLELTGTSVEHVGKDLPQVVA